MALHYEPDKMLKLVQLCCWKERTELSQNGLVELAAKLGPVPQSEEDIRQRRKEQEPNDRYLVDLVSDARKALKNGTTIPKRESYVNLLLHLVGFSSWDDWKEALRSPGYFFSRESAEPGFSNERVLTIVYPELLKKQLSPTLLFAKKSVPVELFPCREETLKEVTEIALAQLEKSSAVICALPSFWKDQAASMRNPAWGTLRKTGRVLPVWVDPDDLWNVTPPFMPALKEQQSTAGLPGLLTGVFFLVQQISANNSENAQEGEGKQSNPGRGPHFKNSTVGFYMQGGTVHHLNTGGDQIINNYIGQDTSENNPI